eukprot:gene5207-6332_t
MVEPMLQEPLLGHGGMSELELTDSGLTDGVMEPGLADVVQDPGLTDSVMAQDGLSG